MDVNNVPFWQMRTDREFGLGGPGGAVQDLEWCAAREALTLADLDPVPQLTEDETRARQLAQAPSCIADSLGGVAWVDATGRVATSGFASPAPSLDLGSGSGAGLPPDDLALGDDIILATRGGSVVMLDLRDRWQVTTVRLDGFAAGLVTAADGHEPWLLDLNTHRLARLRGTPLPSIMHNQRPAARFSDAEDPYAPKIVVQPGLKLPARLRPVAMRTSRGGRLAILCWAPGEEAEIMLLEGKRLVRSRPLAGLLFPTSLAWNGEDELCVLATDGEGMAGRAFAYDLLQLLTGQGPVRPNGKFMPLLDDAGLGLANHAARGALHIARRIEPAPHMVARRLVPLSRAARATAGSVMLGPIDGRTFDCCWHRFYLEADIPQGCGMRIALHASNRVDPPDAPADHASRAGWALHLAGSAGPWPEPDDGAMRPQWPRAAWSHSASEVPGHKGFCPDQRAANRTGLFTCLVQDGRRAVRRVSGRYLFVHIELTSNGRATPELYAMRIYGDRFSYRDCYLPELYGETLSADEARGIAPATRADFLERFVHLLEGPMSEMEARVVQGWTMTDPASVPDEGLDWLAGWTGLDLTDELDMARKRQKLLAAPHLARLNGTLAGLCARIELETGGRLIRGGIADPDLPVPRPGQLAQIAIEGATTRALVLEVIDPRSGGQCTVLVGGDISRGRIVAVEGFRLRRTMGTILGRQLVDPEDPLQPGQAPSGNSIVGDSLILGEEDRHALLSHFGLGEDAREEDRAGLDAFYRKLAHRVLLMVRRQERGSSVPMARLRQAASAAVPAHVVIDVLEMSAPFIAGVASLVGIDSFLGEPFAPEHFRVGDEGGAFPGSALGRTDFIAGFGALDANGEVPAGPPPVARPQGPATASASGGFVLDASRSRSGPGRNLSRYVWTWN